MAGALRRGDVVRACLGRVVFLHAMTIERVDCQRVRCVWFEGKHGPYRATFHATRLLRLRSGR